MALRVLLADNSETIKKVIQLTLQDFSVDLRIVASGVDVLDVVEKFKPDIIFVDILLQKKSGYDVARELKTHPTIGSIPVILMWSGFMEVDEERANATMADARLEKPFDAKTLRDLVAKFVTKTKSNQLSGFLEFPTLPPMDEQVPRKSSSKDPLVELQKIKQESLKFAQNVKTQKSDQPITETLAENELPTLDMDIDLGSDLENQDDFEMQPLSDSSGPSVDAGSFKLEIPDDLISGDDFAVDTGNPEKINDMSFLLNPEAEKAKANNSKTTDLPASPPIVAPVAKTVTPAPLSSSHNTKPQVHFSQEDIEKIVNERVQEVIEKVVWQVVPEMASQIVRNELERLLKDKP